MKISMWTEFLYGLSPEEKVDVYAQCGYQYLELSAEDGVELLRRGQPDKTGRAYAAYARDHGISVLQGHLDLEADIRNAAHAQALKVWLDLHQAIGIRASVLHYGRGADVRLPPNLLLRQRASVIRSLAEHIQGAGMCICLENLISPYDNTCDVLLAIIHEAGDANLGICLDTGHLNLAGGDPAQFVAQAGAYLKALHIADNEGAYDQHLMPYGKGTVPWEPCMRALNNSGYDGLFNFEIPGESTAPLEIRKAKLRYILEMATYMAQIR